MFQEPATDHDQSGVPARAPSSPARSIFRSEARRRHIQNQDKVILPPLTSPHVFGYLWVLALLLMVAGFIIAFWPLIA